MEPKRPAGPSEEDRRSEERRCSGEQASLCVPESHVTSGLPVSSHSRQIQSPACPSRALRAVGTIVTPHVGQIGGRWSSMPEVWSASGACSASRRISRNEHARSDRAVVRDDRVTAGSTDVCYPDLLIAGGRAERTSDAPASHCWHRRLGPAPLT